MLKLAARWWWLSAFSVGLVFSPAPFSQAAPQPAPVSAPNAVIGEGRDFATLVLHDPWDMQEFSDVSMYLNTSGQVNSLQNYTAQNGLFSATAVDADPWFHVLFPGYNTAMLIDKVGARYPIKSATYRCLYLAANMSATTTGEVYWFANETLTSGPFGATNFPVSGGVWRLYAINLNTTTFGSAWASQAQWQGLRIDPMPTTGNFTVDWVRLTDCTTAPLALTGLGNSQAYDFYLVTASGDVLVTAFTANSSGNATVDLQGVPPGTYAWKAKQGNTVAASGSVTINPTPVADFARPSFTSGTDYATQAGNSWDFWHTEDASVGNAAYSFANGLLNLATAAGSGADVDPTLLLNTPQWVTEGSNPYRYLSLRMYTGDPIQNVPKGMIGRLFWYRYGPNNIPCYLGSQDMPFDVGWYTITVDLYNAFNSTPEDVHGDCAGVATNWQTNTPAIRQLRFDPNENILGHTLHQQLDWIRLTKVDEVKLGAPYHIQMTLNLPPSSVLVQQFYYTTDPVNAPTQNVAQPYTSAPATGVNKVFLPFMVRQHWHEYNPPHLTTFWWNTAGVTPNTYYICAHVEDAAATNAAVSTYCSPAPVKVTP